MYKELFKRPFYAQNFAPLSQHVSNAHASYNVLPFLKKIMKLSFLQLLCIAITVQFSWSAPVRAQLLEKRITAEFNNQKLERALKVIATKANIRLVYDSQVWKNAKLVTASFNNVKMKDVLDRLLKDGGVTYEIINDQFMVLKSGITPNPQVLPVTSAPDVNYQLPGFVVTGKIIDENNEPLIGVSVKVKNGNQAVITDSKGNYAIGLAKSNSIIEFSVVGYKTVEMVVTTEGTLNVKMQPDPAKLDEVVVIGYGTTTRRTSTGSQAGISAKEIEKQPVTNVLQAMQGRLPGVAITQTNGLPGAGINVQIRGTNSLLNSNRPFYVIDGVPFLSEPISAAATGTATQSAEGATSPLNTINPSDIESIEVLKDADATAIYGSRGANGVVLITTKKGKAGKTKFGVNASTGMSKVTHFVDLLGTEQYLALRRKGFANNNLTPTAANAPDLLVWDQNANTDFQRLFLGNTAHTNDINANVSGGDVRTNFYLSGTYHKEGNVYPGSQAYQRGGANFNLNHSSADQRFTLSLSAIYSADKNNIATIDLATYAYTLPPNYPLYNPDGSLYYFSTVNNPLGFRDQTNDNRSTNLLSNLVLKYTLLKGLDFKTSVGYSKTDMRTTTIRPSTSLNPALNPTGTGTSAFVYNYTNNYIVEPQLNYKTKAWKGNLDLLAGGTWQFRQSNQPYNILASGFTADVFLNNIASATTRSVSAASMDYKYTSVFARTTYNVDNKYIINGSFRRDGSSRFGPDRQFGHFGAVGAAWVFSEEKFVKDKLDWFSFGKLRGSYGIVGSDEIGNYKYLDTYTSAATSVYATVAALQPTRIANNEFQWESTKKLEIGLELGFLKDRLSLTSSYYRNRSGNQLLDFSISPQTGFASYQANLPATVQNSGVEFLLTSTNIRNKSFTWTTSFNIAKNDNKLLTYPGIEKTSYYSRFIVGNPISAYYVYQYNGINATTGLPDFADLNNSGTISGGFAATGRGDQYYVGTNYPKYFGGLSNSLTYKGLNLDFTFQFVKQQGRSLLNQSFYPPGYMYNASAGITNDYLALGSQDQLVTASTSTAAGLAAYLAYTRYAASNASVVDASFIRMKNISLSYVLPSTWISKVRAQNVRLFLQGQNLFTITKYKGFDPESQGVSTPPLRTIIAGLQCTF
ncbi:SusC/RagA family TonB-linked outer membrane protein [Mucilaginibacter sp. PAMB04274]|uniref:SusC/RagA family TonB-linked outer membrane protein n=1 Tax=Mucilaginibacter sp. PAMB04274 TaxID=3138568 RepID=UPI0031F709A1